MLLCFCSCNVYAISANKVSSSYLRRGSSGSQVRNLQIALNEIVDWGLVVDGIFGKNTYNCVVKFQNKYDLSPDGIADNNAVSKINAVIDESNFKMSTRTSTVPAKNINRGKFYSSNDSKVSISESYNIDLNSKSYNTNFSYKNYAVFFKAYSFNHSSFVVSSSGNSVATVSSGLCSYGKNGNDDSCIIYIYPKKTGNFTINASYIDNDKVKRSFKLSVVIRDSFFKNSTKNNSGSILVLNKASEYNVTIESTSTSKVTRYINSYKVICSSDKSYVLDSLDNLKRVTLKNIHISKNSEFYQKKCRKIIVESKFSDNSTLKFEYLIK